MDALANRSQQNHGGNTDGDAEQRQKAAQAVRGNGAQGKVNGVGRADHTESRGRQESTAEAQRHRGFTEKTSKMLFLCVFSVPLRLCGGFFFIPLPLRQRLYRVEPCRLSCGEDAEEDAGE